MSLTPQEARHIIRKAVKRVPEGEEVRGLNIMPLVAIASILLLAVIVQTSITNYHAIGDVDLPQSRSFDPEPEGAVTLTIARSAILVEGEPIVPVDDGSVDSSFKRDGTLGLTIPRVSDILAAVRRDADRRAELRGQEPAKDPELVIIADSMIPYRLLFEVILSARHEDAGYELFRLLVIDPETGETQAQQAAE